MKRLFPVLAASVGVALTFGIAMADDEADRAAIREMENQCLKAAQAKNVGRWVSCFTEDATVFPPNEPTITGKKAIHQWLSEVVANPSFAVNMETTKVDVSSAGDMGYASGIYDVTLNDEEGNPFQERGKWVEVYKKQSDGAWKCVAVIWTPDQPSA